MVQKTTAVLGWMLLSLAVLGLGGPVHADEPRQVALVVQFGDGRVETRCVSLEDDTASGAEVLARSGLEVIVETSGGMGLTICQIEAEGCPYPAEPCFCQCMGSGECTYWNYFYRDPGESAWNYSALGAALRKVKPGSVEGWVWGAGDTPPAEEINFEAICIPPTAAPTATPEPPAPPPTVAAAEPTEGPPPTEAATAVLPSTAPPASPTPQAAAIAEPAQSSYWPFGLMVLGLGLAGALVWLRRR